VELEDGETEQLNPDPEGGSTAGLVYSQKPYPEEQLATSVQFFGTAKPLVIVPLQVVAPEGTEPPQE